MKCVVLESPYAGDIERNTQYARDCVKDCLSRGEAPIASHLLFPSILDDTDPAERLLGISAGHAWIPVAEACVVYLNLGYTEGMKAGVRAANAAGVPVIHRALPDWS